MKSENIPLSVRNVKRREKYNNHVKSNQILILCVFFVLLTILHIQPTSAYCWQVGWNPGFTNEPKVYQISLTKVRVSWKGAVNQRKCADSFLVKYWRESRPSDYQMTKQVNALSNYIDVEVKPKIRYVFQVVAREDKGWFLGVDYNRSKRVKFSTSVNREQPLPNPSNLNPDVSVGHFNKFEQEEMILNKDKVAIGISITVEILVVVIFSSLIFLLIIIGFIYQVFCKNMSLLYKDEGDDVESAKEINVEYDQNVSEDEEQNPN